MNIYFEARSEPIAGQFAVAEVALQRAKNSGRTVCQEIHRPYQFSWTLLPEEKLRIRDLKAWKLARQIASQVWNRRTYWSRGATHFHANYVYPYWAPKLCQTAVIGAHIFYRECPAPPVTPAMVLALQ